MHFVCSPRRIDSPERVGASFHSAARASGLGAIAVSSWPRPSCEKQLEVSDARKQRKPFKELVFIRLPKWAANGLAITREPPSLPLVNKTQHENQDKPNKRSWWITSPRARSIFLLNLLTILYGSNATVIKQAETLMDPAILSAIRFSIASLAFSPFLIRAFRDSRTTEAGFELGILSSMGYLSQSIGLITTDAGRASFVCALTVVVVPLISGLTGSHISNVIWISAATALLGTGLLESSGPSLSIGDLWNLISAISFGIHMLRTEHFSRSLPSTTAMPLLSLQLFVVTMLSSFWAIFKHASGMIPSHIPEFVKHVPQLFATIPWLSLCYTGFISTAFCLWVELVSLRDISSTEAAIVYTLEPLWGASFAWIFLGERWAPMAWLGAALILGGSLTMQLFGREEMDAVIPHVADHQNHAELLEDAHRDT